MVCAREPCPFHPYLMLFPQRAAPDKGHRQSPEADLQLAMKACPYRATFYPKLGEPQSEVLPKLEAWLAALEAIVAREAKVFKDGGYGEI